MYRVCSCVVQFSRDPAEGRAEMDEDVFPPSLYREILDDKKRHPRRLSSKNPRVWLNKAPSPTRSSPLASAGHAVCHLAGDPRGSGLRAGIVRRLRVQHILAAGGLTSAVAIGETGAWRNKSQGSSNKLLVRTQAPAYRYPVPGVTAPLSHQALCRRPGDAAGGSAVGAHCGP